MVSEANASEAGGDAARSGFLPNKIIHLHPTRLCNLACRHCYSDSAPQQRGAIDLAALERALPMLRAEGYAVLSLSGGEPLVYPSLLPLVERAKTEGFRVTMITNGLLMEQMDAVLAQLDAVAVSFDGLAATHNHLRGRPDAFARASATMQRLASRGWPAAAAISLTRNVIPELPDLAEHLVQLGVTVLQVRPVARAGRARQLNDSCFYEPPDLARLYLVVLALQQELGDSVRIHCDLAPVQALWQQRDAYAALLATCASEPVDHPLSELVNPLVITETGILKPIAYDFHPAFEVDNLRTLSPERLTRYKRFDLAGFRSLIGYALAQLQHGEGFVDWFDFCTRLSEHAKNTSLNMASAMAPFHQLRGG